ncbi:MAG TPA: hypothetical protein VF444_09205 [Pseudonocardiaceae bacterium]
MPQPFPPGTRRVPRPRTVDRCVECTDLAGRGYPDCAGCASLVDGLWLADWSVLLRARSVLPGGEPERDLARQVLVAPAGDYSWTCVDTAMSVLRCPRCGQELGAGPVGCVFCRVGDERRWGWEDRAPKGAIGANEHMLRVARAVLRATHRHRATVVLNWRLVIPFLLVGENVDDTTQHWIRAYLRAGRYAELAAAGSLTQLAGLASLPWR